jgi:hypothetical protein
MSISAKREPTAPREQTRKVELLSFYDPPRLGHT